MQQNHPLSVRETRPKTALVSTILLKPTSGPVQSRVLEPRMQGGRRRARVLVGDTGFEEPSTPEKQREIPD
jgi:hypothetical protein